MILSVGWAGFLVSPFVIGLHENTPGLVVRGYFRVYNFCICFRAWIVYDFVLGLILEL